MSSKKLRFGGWVFDPESGDLEREGTRTRLQEQPARALKELLGHAGNIVTREQMIGLLWPKGVVDFDTSLNTLIRKLRSALGDVADTPRYIETLPRRGYRFIGTLDPEAQAASRTSGEVRQSVPSAPGMTTGTASGPVRIAICVMPFKNLSGDAEGEVLSDGISEDIITELSRWRMLEVRSRSASVKYPGTNLDVAGVAAELSVRFVVEGSVRRLGNRVRITVQLINALNGHQVWGERFDRGQSEVFAVQDEVVQRIVSTLVGRVRVTDVERARRKQPASLEAYECVLKGNALAWDDPVEADEAKRLFETAIEVDPGYGMAYALLAIMHVNQWKDDFAEATDELDEAYRMAMRAVDLDDGESTCHSMLAQVCLFRRSFELAMQHIRRAVELNPNNQWNVADVGFVLTYAGQAEEALTWSERAKNIDPFFDPPWYWRQAGRVNMVLRRYREALAMFEHIPLRNFRDAAYMAGCYARLSENQHAHTFVSECLEKQPKFTIRRMMTKEPYKLAAEAEHLEQSFRLAGLPE